MLNTSESRPHSCSRSSAKYLHPRASFFGVASLFGPLVFTFIVNRQMRRDIQLTAEAELVVAESTAGMGPGANQAEVVLRIHLELQTILCTEYRYVPIQAVSRLLPLQVLE